MNREEIMAEAIKRYPPGTIFNSLGGNDGVIVKDPTLFKWAGNKIVGSNAVERNRSCVIYRSKHFNPGDPERWAEIMSYPKDYNPGESYPIF